MSKVYRWRKLPNTGSHSFVYNGEKHRVVPGDLVECTLDPIRPFKEEYDLLGEVEDDELIPLNENEVEEDEEDDITLQVVSRGGGYYDVINPEDPDNPINDKGLRKKEAYDLAGLEVPSWRRK